MTSAYVIDASVAYAMIVGVEPVSEELATLLAQDGNELVAPKHLDVELLNALRSNMLHRELDLERAEQALISLALLRVERHDIDPSFYARIWQLRDNLSSYDATYVTLAERLDCTLLTADGRLARAPGLECDVRLLPT